MTTITLEVPDELAAQFKIEPAHLPALIREAVEARLSKPARTPASPEAAPSLYQEIINFLTSNPALEQVADFKISAPAQERLEELLDKNREEGLTPEEKTQLERYLHYRHVMILLKASAHRVLNQRPK
jgi:hypothetical protein